MSTFPAGRDAALARLAALRPDRYARSRNFLDGAVSRLSPYLRHGVLELAEVRDAVLGLVRRDGDASKFVQELAWREYWRRVYAAIGERIHQDLEGPKTGVAGYAAALPDDVRDARTGLACMDTFVRDLVETGYVHNHARMWFASYVVHHRRVHWSAGARFYLRYLLDGDPASNSLSWQWVASTFSNKPYIFNRENLERYTDGALCRRCPLATGGCPFDASYETLTARLFAPSLDDGSTAPVLRAEADAPAPAVPTRNRVVWTHPDALSDTSAARRAAPDAPVIVAGVAAMATRDAWSATRRGLVDATIAGLRVDVREHDRAADAIVAFARERTADAVVTVASPDPLLREIARDVARTLPVIVVPPPRFVAVQRAVTLRRFSAFWKHVEASAFEPTAYDESAATRSSPTAT